MVTNNSVKISTAGIVKYDGTSSFSAVTTTQYNVLVGDTANGIASVAPSATAGYKIWVDPTVQFNHAGTVGCLMNALTDKKDGTKETKEEGNLT